MKITEQGFNKFIAGGQWSSSFFIAAAFLLVLLGVKVPEWLSNGFLFTVCLTAPLFLTVGMFQVWRLPGKRRWLAVPASLFLILSGVMMFATVVERDREKSAKAMMEAVHSSAAWMVATGEYTVALDAYKVLAARTFPADFPKRFQENEDAKTAQWATVQAKAKALKELEPAVSIEARTPFDIFGKDWAWVVASVFLALYALVNEATALTLAARVKDTAPKAAQKAGQSTQTSAPVFGVDEYLEAALRLGKNGVLAGYRQVAEDTGQTAYRCRELFGEAIQSGKIKKKPGARGAREEASA